ncbi:MAG: DDE-type integrase/transposase/recombinase, partial [Gammaproteobacteria bacterium]|nr:DDE-type integrase/transposase/recombinase [Gammaproteobacteria bacterium]
IDKRMTTDLISKALIKAYNLRQPARGLVFHSDRGSQYTSKQFGRLLSSYGIRASMDDVGACSAIGSCVALPPASMQSWDNAVVERFFGSLKNDWIFKVNQPTMEFMKQNVSAYMKYYNLDRLHSANDNLSPVEFENSQVKVSSLG